MPATNFPEYARIIEGRGRRERGRWKMEEGKGKMEEGYEAARVCWGGDVDF